MSVWVAAAWMVTGGSVALLTAAVVLRLNAYRRSAGQPAAEAVDFSMDRYQPMAKLLADDDFVFLEAQPGYRASIGSQLKRGRRQVFRLYLGELASDFHRLHAEARLSLVNSPAEHAELVGILMRQQLVFWRAMAGVEFRLTLDQLGIGKVDVSGLMDAFEGMRLDLARFSTPQPVVG
jgi:hypothetical protein